MQRVNLAGVTQTGGIRWYRSGRMGRIQAALLLRSRRHCDGKRGDITRGAACLGARSGLRLRIVSDDRAVLTRNPMVVRGSVRVLTTFVAVFPRDLKGREVVVRPDADRCFSAAGNRRADQRWTRDQRCGEQTRQVLCMS